MIGKVRQERLWNHLLELEKQTGMSLRSEPRDYGIDCPVAAFAPDCNKKKQHFSGVGFIGEVYYGEFEKGYSIYEPESGNWWAGLSRKTKKETINWLKSKIKEHLK